MDADGSNPTNLSNNTATEFDPAWSPDGTRIAFDSDRDGNSEIYVMDADGANQTRLTINTSNEHKPTWSPDGTRIAFNSDRDGNYEIYVMDANGSNQTNLSNNTATEYWNDWQVATDTDGDGVADAIDNCTNIANATQCDSDDDGYGNHCDGDLNNNGFTNAFDTPLYRAQLGQPSVGPTYNEADLNCNGFVNAFDTPLFRSLLGKAPGPSGLVP
jgi:Tol biopolymer transport system component